jgi:hypothetical protein
MRRRYKQNPDGTLEFVGEIRQAPYASDTFCAGDIPDKMKDVERRKRDTARQQKKERLNTLIDNFNRYGR